MGAARLPGPLCGESQSWSLLDGTTALWSMPPPLLACGRTSGLPGLPVPAQPIDLSFLFTQCRAPKMGITDEDYDEAAKTLGVEVAVVKAVSTVETAGESFDIAGRPRILFERHYFHRLTAGAYDTHHARISAKSSGGYGKFSEQYKKLGRRTCSTRTQRWNPRRGAPSRSWANLIAGLGSHPSRRSCRP